MKLGYIVVGGGRGVEVAKRATQVSQCHCLEVGTQLFTKTNASRNIHKHEEIIAEYKENDRFDVEHMAIAEAGPLLSETSELDIKAIRSR